MLWKNFRRTVRRAIDGDTLELCRRAYGTNRVRLANVNAPERGESGYARAKNSLARLEGRTVTISPKAWSYNRLVADVYNKRKKVR